MSLPEEKKISKRIQSEFKVKGFSISKRRIWLTAQRENLLDLCFLVKEMGFDHLSSISVTDWPDDGEFELTYHVWSYSKKILITIRVRVDRDKPEVHSTFPIWKENAGIHEREMHEMFGVVFEGNPDLSSLFLEDWEGPPPFRKDFDWRKYVREKCYSADEDREKAYFRGGS